jgi:type I restriction enzyme S subunit
MSGLNFLERLLDGAAVEWKPLGDVIVSLKTGLNPRQNFQLNTEDAEGYYVTVREIQNGNIVFSDKTDRVNKKALELINNRSNLEIGDILFSGTGTVGRNAVIEKQPENWNIKEGVYVIKPIHKIINPQYLSHLLNSKEIVKEYTKKIVGSPVISLPMGDLKKLQIPTPCPDNPDRSLAIQAEIVRILDTFTALTAELTAELSDRQKQYNYYRDRLLTFGDEIPVMQLSQCCVTIADGDHQAPPQTNTGIPFITISNVSNSYQIDFTNTKFVSEAYYSELDDKRKARKNDILYTVVGSFGIPVFINENKKFTFQRHIAILRPNGNVIIPKYLYHVLRSSDFLKQAHVVAVGAAQKTITLTALNRMKVPVPPLAEQARIVAILDKFDTLTHSISEGLPREIALRHKQYEHYRDLLLSFPPPLTPP